MQIGKLRRPLDLLKLVRQQDPETGEMIETWVKFSREWAEAEGISGREFLAAGAEQSSTTFRVTIRYRDDLTTAMRFDYAGKVYTIKAILPDNKRKLLVCMCEEGLV